MSASCRREYTSILIYSFASRKKLPLLCILKSRNILDLWYNQTDYDKTAYAASKQRRIASKIFFNWFVKVFLSKIPEAKPVHLVFDNHASEAYFIHKTQENNVHILRLLLHLTH